MGKYDIRPPILKYSALVDGKRSDGTWKNERTASIETLQVKHFNPVG